MPLAPNNPNWRYMTVDLISGIDEVVHFSEVRNDKIGIIRVKTLQALALFYISS